jgi:hypothetical protein
MKTKAGAICGGFTMQDWTSDGVYKSDSCAFVFRLDTKATYSPKLQSKAIWCGGGEGPYFGDDALTLWYDPMNGPGNGRCYVDKDGCDTNYKIKEDENANSPLTGEGADNEGHDKEFTCVELEVY